MISRNNKITVREAFVFGKGYLRSRGIDTYESDAELIIMNLMDFTRVQLYMDDLATMSDKLYNEYTMLLRKRTRNTPVAYITNKCEFYSIPFYVDERTLIPRQDTEVLVETVVSYTNKTIVTRKKRSRILEIGTGSGCISIAIAKNCYNVEIVATDISHEALVVARKNADKNGVCDQISFVECDLVTEAIAGQAFDIIVSNPPYIPSGDIKDLEKSVRAFEPHIALDGGNDGMDFYRKITKAVKPLLVPKGMLFYEIGYNQAKGVRDILIQNGFDEETITVIKDFADKNRVIYGRK